jgi:hypothetical protein
LINQIRHHDMRPEKRVIPSTLVIRESSLLRGSL